MPKNEKDAFEVKDLFKSNSITLLPRDMSTSQLLSRSKENLKTSSIENLTNLKKSMDQIPIRRQSEGYSIQSNVPISNDRSNGESKSGDLVKKSEQDIQVKKSGKHGNEKPRFKTGNAFDQIKIVEFLRNRERAKNINFDIEKQKKRRSVTEMKSNHDNETQSKSSNLLDTVSTSRDKIRLVKWGVIAMELLGSDEQITNNLSDFMNDFIAVEEKVERIKISKLQKESMDVDFINGPEIMGFSQDQLLLMLWGCYKYISLIHPILIHRTILNKLLSCVEKNPQDLSNWISQIDPERMIILKAILGHLKRLLSFTPESIAIPLLFSIPLLVDPDQALTDKRVFFEELVEMSNTDNEISINSKLLDYFLVHYNELFDD